MRPSLSSSFVLSSLWLVVNSQFPECITPACTPLKDAISGPCDYDISQTKNATADQTRCICGLPEITGLLQMCFNCLDLNTIKDNADYFAEICPALSVTRAGASTTGTSVILGSSSAPSQPPTKTGATIATSTKITTDAITTSPTTTQPGSSTSTDTNTDTDTDSDSSPTGDDPTVLIDLEPTSRSTGAASHYTPVFGLAAILLVAQAGL